MIFGIVSGRTQTATQSVAARRARPYTSGKLTSVEDQAEVSQSYSYDSDNNRTGVTVRRGHAWSFTFDSTGSLLRKADPLTHTWTGTCNSRNDVITLTDPLSLVVVTNTYDSNGNLAAPTAPVARATACIVNGYGVNL